MSTSYYRERARRVLDGKWANAVLVALVACIFGALLTGSNFSLELELDENTIRHIPEALVVPLTMVTSVGSFFSFVQFIMGGVIRLGYCSYLLKLEDHKEGNVKVLFSQMDSFVDGFLLNLLTGLFTFLWALLFIIPGIIASYRYAMAPFLLLENPHMKPRDAIEASKSLMDGHKMELFLLDLSFIGWHLLGLVTLGIAYLWINPYINSSRAAFYRSLRPRMEFPPVDENWNTPITDFTVAG